MGIMRIGPSLLQTHQRWLEFASTARQTGILTWAEKIYCKSNELFHLGPKPQIRVDKKHTVFKEFNSSKDTF